MGSRTGAVVGTVAPGPLPSCVDCGACCFSPDRDYIRVFEIDVERMDAVALAFTEGSEGRRSMRMAAGRCSALIVDGEARSLRCAIYEARPDVCRSLERASGGCHQQRAEKAGLALVALGARRSRPPA